VAGIAANTGATGPTGPNYWALSGTGIFYGGFVGVNIAAPKYTLDVSGVSRTTGLITGGTTSGTFGSITSYTRNYSFFQQVNSGSNITVIFNFANTSTYIKIIAMALEQSNANNISTYVIEATGGQMFAATPTNSFNVINKTLATNGSYPWNATVATGITSITLTTSNASTIGYYFNFRIETFGGNATNINVNGVTAITYNY